MRCLHCGKRLALLRKLRNEQYCSDEHELVFKQKQEELALSRLIEVQQQALSPAPRRPLFAPPQPVRRVVEAIPEIAWLLATDVEIQGAPLRFRVPLADPYEFEFVWLYPHYEFERPKRRVLGAGAVLPLLVPAPAAAPFCPSCGPERFASSLAIPSRPAFERLLGGAGRLPSIFPDPRRLPPVPRIVASDPTILDAIPGAAAATSVQLATALRPAGSIAIWDPAPLSGVAPQARIPDLSLAIETSRVRWKSLVAPALRAPVAPALVAPVERVTPAKIEPATSGLLGLSGPAIQPLAARTAFGEDAIGAHPATNPPIPDTGLRAARLGHCGPKVASLRTPALGNRLPISWMEGAALVSVRYRLPKRAARQQNSDLGFARRMPLTIPIAGKFRLQGEKPEALPPPRFLVPPPISVAALPDFSPPQFPMVPVAVRAAKSESTGQRFEYPHVSRTMEPELRLPLGPGAEIDFGIPPAFAAALTTLQPAAIAPPEATRRATDAQPLAPTETLVSCLQAPVPAAVQMIAQRSRVELFRLGHEKIVPRSAGEKNKWLEAIVWPSPKPLMPPSSRLRGSIGSKGPEVERPAAPWLVMENISHAWQRVPTSAKWSGAVMAVLVTLALGWNAVGPSPQTVSASTVSTASFFSGTLRSVKDGILRRAAISLTDDFRLGLSEWEGEGDWANEWSYDTAGFVRIGSMALYSPSLALSDYRMEFLGQIERKGMSWAVRAADYKNYYAVKLMIVKPGPLPTAAIFRYPVINGKPGKAVEVPLRIPLRSDTVYRVMMETRGDNFTLAVNGIVIDTWTESRMPKGGIGFFSAKGERARLRWVGVWHQYDTLGRLCAYLTPLSMSSKDRSINQ